MRITIKTIVNASIDNVWKGFDRQLFEALAPPFPPVKLIRFDGCKKGDVVQLELNFLLFKQSWDALIIENGQDASQYYFIDNGTKLPFFLSKWTHRHGISKVDLHTQIIDDITFSSPFGIFIYPILYLQFLYRKPIYKRIFGK